MAVNSKSKNPIFGPSNGAKASPLKRTGSEDGSKGLSRQFRSKLRGGIESVVAFMSRPTVSSQGNVGHSEVPAGNQGG